MELLVEALHYSRLREQRLEPVALQQLARKLAGRYPPRLRVLLAVVGELSVAVGV
jgi:hypothetical protein